MRRLLIVIALAVAAATLSGCFWHPHGHPHNCRTQCESWSQRRSCHQSCAVYRDGYCVVRRRVCRDERYCVRRVQHCNE